MSTMKAYIVAKITQETYGQGDTGTETRICRMGGYGSGEFPPAFLSRDGAAEWLKAKRAERALFSDAEIVEISIDGAISPQWTPGDKPPTSGEYLVTLVFHSDRIVMEAVYRPAERFEWSLHNASGATFNLQCCSVGASIEVVAWMPKPKPYAP